MTVESDELKHDTSGFSESQLAPFLQEAMDGIIDDLFMGKMVGRYGLEAYVEQFAGDIAANFVTGAPHNSFRGLLEELIRRELEGSDELREAAAELANQPEE